jgi:hypothetical protein
VPGKKIKGLGFCGSTLLRATYRLAECVAKCSVHTLKVCKVCPTYLLPPLLLLLLLPLLLLSVTDPDCCVSYRRSADEGIAAVESRGQAALKRLFPKAAAAGRLKGEKYNTRIFLSSFMIKVRFAYTGFQPKYIHSLTMLFP